MSEPNFTNYQEIENRVVERRAGKSVLTQNPKVSVVIPCYNNADVISETLQTVFAQTFQDFEVILVNDGSPDSDELEQNLSPFFDKIVYIKQKNHGASAARNTGIHFSRGEFIAFLDGDDLWLPEYLSEQLKFIKKMGFQMVYADALMFGQKLWEGKNYMKKSPSFGDVTPAKLILAQCNVITSGTVVEKRQVIKRQGFDESDEARRVEDFDLWFGLSKHGCRIGYQHKILLKYRVTSTGLSGGNISRDERTIQAMRLIKAKYDLNETETAAWEKQVKFFAAQLELEKGKLCLIEEDFEQARAHLVEANKYLHKTKLRCVIWLLKSRPFLVKRIYEKLRSDEFDLINPNLSRK